MFNNCWVAGGGECLGYACYGGIPMTMTSYTKRCTRSRRVCWCKFEWNPTSSFCVICDLVSLSLIQKQGVILVFACLFIYSLTRGPELFACLSIYENAETLSHHLLFGFGSMEIAQKDLCYVQMIDFKTKPHAYTKLNCTSNVQMCIVCSDRPFIEATIRNWISSAGSETQSMIK